MNGEQLSIDVTPSPNAVGRWTVDHEIESYRKLMGEDTAERQRALAKVAKDCTCGRQETADAKARNENLKPKRLLGWEHVPGCNSYSRRQPKLARISPEEQLDRYEHQQRVDQLRDALADARAEEGEPPC